MKIHTMNTGRQYSEHGQRIAYTIIGTTGRGNLVAFYDADRHVHNVAVVQGLVTDSAFLDAYDHCRYDHLIWLTAEQQDVLRLAAENHGKEAIAECGACPSCSSGELSGGFVNIEGNRAYQTVTCTNCGTAWVEGYALVSRELVEG